MAETTRQLRNALQSALKRVGELENEIKMLKLECPICWHRTEEPVYTPCNHIFCSICIREHLRAVNAACPMCRRTIAVGDLQAVEAPVLDHPRPQQTHARQVRIGRQGMYGSNILQNGIPAQEANAAMDTPPHIRDPRVVPQAMHGNHNQDVEYASQLQDRLSEDASALLERIEHMRRQARER